MPVPDTPFGAEVPWRAVAVVSLVDQGAGGFCGRQMLSGMIVTSPDFCGVFILLHSSLGVKGKGVIPKSPSHLVGRPHPNSAWTV